MCVQEVIDFCELFAKYSFGMIPHPKLGYVIKAIAAVDNDNDGKISRDEIIDVCKWLIERKDIIGGWSWIYDALSVKNITKEVTALTF